MEDLLTTATGTNTNAVTGTKVQMLTQKHADRHGGPLENTQTTHSASS
jgi:hypothetical protein